MHSLSGCDTTSKVGTKLQAFKAANKPEHEKLANFGTKKLDDDMLMSAEQFLLDSMSRKADRTFETFDELRYSQYHAKNSTVPLEKLPCTSVSLSKQIRWAYYQCNLWVSAATFASPQLDPTDYYYGLDQKGLLHPMITTEQSIPEDFPTCVPV